MEEEIKVTGSTGIFKAGMITQAEPVTICGRTFSDLVHQSTIRVILLRVISNIHPFYPLVGIHFPPVIQSP